MKRSQGQERSQVGMREQRKGTRRKGREMGDEELEERPAGGKSDARKGEDAS